MSDAEQVDDLAEDLEASDADVTQSQRTRAFRYLVGVFAVLGGLLVAAVHVGLIDLSIVINAAVNVGWIVEYAIAAVMVLFVTSLVAAFVVWLPGSVLGGLTRLVGAVALGVVEQQSGGADRGQAEGSQEDATDG